MTEAYTGGKGRIYQRIINEIPPHRLYIEPFLGNGSIMRRKRAAALSIGIEINPQVIADRWAHHGIPDLTVICGDAIELLQTIEVDRETFIYLDPPYLMHTRSSGRALYDCEFATIEHHVHLLSLIKAMSASMAISGYDNELYRQMLAGWRTIHIPTTNRAGKPAIETVWMNYAPPGELHDYRYLGQNFRERERIRRQQQRWRSRLSSMPRLERLALQSVLNEETA